MLDVVGAVVGWEGDASEDYFGAAGLQRGDDSIEVGAGVLDTQAAEAVVAAELDDDDGGVQGEDAGEAHDTVFGGVAADALVENAIVVTAGVEYGLEVVGVALTGVGAVAGGEAVAEAGDDWAGVIRKRWGRRPSVGDRWFGGVAGGGGAGCIAGVVAGLGVHAGGVLRGAIGTASKRCE